VYALDRLDASAFTTGNDLPVNRQTLFGCQMYYGSILFRQTKSGKTRVVWVVFFPPLLRRRDAASITMLKRQELLAAALDKQFPA
jgi:hypothetical protein